MKGMRSLDESNSRILVSLFDKLTGNAIHRQVTSSEVCDVLKCFNRSSFGPNDIPDIVFLEYLEILARFWLHAWNLSNFQVDGCMWQWISEVVCCVRFLYWILHWNLVKISVKSYEVFEETGKPYWISKFLIDLTKIRIIVENFSKLSNFSNIVLYFFWNFLCMACISFSRCDKRATVVCIRESKNCKCRNDQQTLQSPWS